MIEGLAWTSPPVRTVEVPEPSAEPLDIPPATIPEKPVTREPVPAGVP